MPIENLTVVVPFWNGHETLGRLLDSLPAGLPVLVVDDQSDESPDVNGRAGVRVIRPKAKGFFSGAVNAGLKGCRTDVLVLNQDLWFTSDGWLDRVAEMRDRVAFFGDGVMAHPAWKKGYVQGTFMFMRRDMIGRAGMLNAEEYPLWGATAEYQLRACRHGFQAQADRDWRRWYGHEGRHGEGGKPVVGRRPRFGGAITEAMKRWPSRRWQFVRTPPAISVIMPETAEVAGNIVDTSWGNGIFTLGGKTNRSVNDVPLARMIVHHNQLDNTMLGRTTRSRTRRHGRSRVHRSSAM